MATLFTYCGEDDQKITSVTGITRENVLTLLQQAVDAKAENISFGAFKSDMGNTDVDEYGIYLVKAQPVCGGWEFE